MRLVVESHSFRFRFKATVQADARSRPGWTATKSYLQLLCLYVHRNVRLAHRIVANMRQPLVNLVCSTVSLGTQLTGTLCFTVLQVGIQRKDLEAMH